MDQIGFFTHAEAVVYASNVADIHNANPYLKPVKVELVKYEVDKWRVVALWSMTTQISLIEYGGYSERGAVLSCVTGLIELPETEYRHRRGLNHPTAMEWIPGWRD